MKLVNPTDDQLNAAFAEKVAGWRCYKEKRGGYELCISLAPGDGEPWQHWDPKERAVREARYTPVSCFEAIEIGFFGRGLPQFTRSADAVLPWLEKSGAWSAYRERDGAYEIELHDKHMPSGGNYFAFDKSFSRAAVIALLRAHGVEVTFTE